MATEQEQAPPRDFDAEQAVLGSMLLEPGAAARAFAIVGADDFYWQDHQEIFRAIEACVNRDEPADLVTVSSELRRLSLLEQIGGGTYLTALISQVPTAAHVVRYATIVAEKSVLREMIAQGATIQAEALANPADPGAAIAAAEERFQRLITSRLRSGMLQPVTDRLSDMMTTQVARTEDTSHEISDAHTGIVALDRISGGLEMERMVVLLAETKHGKSQLTTQTMIETARAFRDAAQRENREPRTVVWFVLEEDQDQWFANVTAYLSGIDSRVLRRRGWWAKYVAKNPWADEARTRAWAELATLGNLKPEFTTKDVRAIGTLCRAEARAFDLGLVGIDNFQNLFGFDDQANEERRLSRCAEYLDHLFTKELMIPAFVPSQVTDRRDIKTLMPKGCKRIAEVATWVLELVRDKEQGKFIDRAWLRTQVSRNGNNFAPLELKTDMTCGRFWDAEEYRRLRQYEQQQQRDGAA